MWLKRAITQHMVVNTTLPHAIRSTVLHATQHVATVKNRAHQAVTVKAVVVVAAVAVVLFVTLLAGALVHVLLLVALPALA